MGLIQPTEVPKSRAKASLKEQNLPVNSSFAPCPQVPACSCWQPGLGIWGSLSLLLVLVLWLNPGWYRGHQQIYDIDHILCHRTCEISQGKKKEERQGETSLGYTNILRLVQRGKERKRDWEGRAHGVRTSPCKCVVTNQEKKVFQEWGSSLE